MTLTLIILAYVANLFLNRWLNKLLYQKYKEKVVPFLWFFSLIATVAFLIILMDACRKGDNWFNGKNW